MKIIGFSLLSWIINPRRILTPPSAPVLLQEDGFFLLQEDGSKIEI